MYTENNFYKRESEIQHVENTNTNFLFDVNVFPNKLPVTLI